MAVKKTDTASGNIDSVLSEARDFPPPESFSRNAHIKSMAECRRLWDEAYKDPNAFWGARGREEIYWKAPFKTVLDWKPPHARWYLEGTTNLSYNCLDRHLPKLKDRTAILWEGEPGEVRRITYAQLLADVNRLANGLRGLGVKKGDRVGIYLPMVPESAVALLACARIGAIQSLVFGGFSAEAVRERVNDVGWDELLKKQKTECEPEWVESEHPLFILYTSGSTGKPKGVLHTTGGYAVYVSLTTRWVFDLRDEDIYWCTADVGWVTGHSYVVYGPLMNGATSVMYEGAPTTPGPDRFWDLIERHRVTVFYTAPTAIRAFMRLGPEHAKKHDLSRLRLLGTVGEPINPEAWMWYRETIGGNRCPIVDTWWQTETGHIMLTPIPGAIATKPGSATRPFPGIVAEIVTMDGTAVPAGSDFGDDPGEWPRGRAGLSSDGARNRRQHN